MLLRSRADSLQVYLSGSLNSVIVVMLWLFWMLTTLQRTQMSRAWVILDFFFHPPSLIKDNKHLLFLSHCPHTISFLEKDSVGQRMSCDPVIIHYCRYLKLAPKPTTVPRASNNPIPRRSSNLCRSIFSIKSCHTSTCPFSLYAGIIHWPHPLTSPLITPFCHRGPVPPSTACDNTALIPLFSQSLPWMKERI